MPTDNKKVLYEFEIDGQPYRIFDTAISESGTLKDNLKISGPDGNPIEVTPELAGKIKSQIDQQNTPRNFFDAGKEFHWNPRYTYSSAFDPRAAIKPVRAGLEWFGDRVLLPGMQNLERSMVSSASMNPSMVYTGVTNPTYNYLQNIDTPVSNFTAQYVFPSMMPSRLIGTIKSGKAPWDPENPGFFEDQDLDLMFDLGVTPAAAKAFKNARTAASKWTSRFKPRQVATDLVEKPQSGVQNAVQETGGVTVNGQGVLRRPYSAQQKSSYTDKATTIEPRTLSLDDMDKALAFSDAKQAGYDMYGSPVWEQRMRNAGFSEREIQEAKDIYRNNLEGTQLMEGEGHITDDSLGQFNTENDFYYWQYLDDPNHAPKSDVSLSVDNNLTSSLIRGHNQNRTYSGLRDTAIHEVNGHAASGNIYNFYQDTLGADPSIISEWNELNPTLAKMIEHNNGLLPKFKNNPSSYYRMPEEVRARVVSARETVKDVLRRRYPELEKTSPEIFEQKVNSAFNSMINKGKSHGNLDISDILNYYDPIDIQLYNERFLKKGGNIKINGQSNSD